ncbi:MAG: hypothetical protein NTW21_24435 [Verrucomicrobia bacterium]|nr:hypothetical protein [Verrucomicrobiota bacterium]
MISDQEERKNRARQITFSLPFNIQHSTLASAAQQAEHAETAEQCATGFRNGSDYEIIGTTVIILATTGLDEEM